jgi:N-acyl-L-homoserine lactone synthetase
MLQKQQQTAHRPGRNLHVGLATSETEILEAQKLRYRVFADELGARLPTRSPGVDRDIYDPFCEHLIVRDEGAGRIVGTYRILSPSAARRVGGYYSETNSTSPACSTCAAAWSRSAARASTPTTAAARSSRCCGRGSRATCRKTATTT